MAQMKYSEMMTRLETIVATLEKGDVELEAALELFDEASKLIKQCNTVLTESRLKITQLSELTAEGNDEQDN